MDTGSLPSPDSRPDVTREAAGLGWPILNDPDVALDPVAGRLLPRSAAAVAVAVSDTVLQVAVDHIPTAATLAALERATGLQVAAHVTSPTVLDHLRARATHADARHPAELLNDVTSAFPAAAAVMLAVGQPPMVTTDSGHHPLPGWAPVTDDDVSVTADFLLGRHARAADQPGTGPDRRGRATWNTATWRATLTRAAGHPTLTLRKTAERRTLEDLGLPAAAADLCTTNHGLVVLASPPGNGRTTTLTAVLDRINATTATTIVRVGDVDDQPLTSRRSLVTTRLLPAGGDPRATDPADVSSVAQAARDAISAGSKILAVDSWPLTSDDVLMLGQAAAAGLLVIVTVPAPDLGTALTSLAAAVDERHAGAAGMLLARTYTAGVAQMLLPRSGGGLVPAAELWWATPALAAQLRTLTVEHLDAAATAAGGRHPNQSMQASVDALIRAGVVADTAAVIHGYRRLTPLVDVSDVPDEWAAGQGGKARRLGKGAARTSTSPTASPTSPPPASGAGKRRRHQKADRAARAAQDLLNERIDT